MFEERNPFANLYNLGLLFHSMFSDSPSLFGERVIGDWCLPADAGGVVCKDDNCLGCMRGGPRFCNYALRVYRGDNAVHGVSTYRSI